MNFSHADIPPGIEQSLPLVDEVAVVIDEDDRRSQLSDDDVLAKVQWFRCQYGVPTHLRPRCRNGHCLHDAPQTETRTAVAGRLMRA